MSQIIAQADLEELKEIEDPIEMYYALFPVERAMSESYIHRDLTEYLRNLLQWYYRGQKCIVTANLVVYRDVKLMTSPDVALIKGVTLSDTRRKNLRGWRVSAPRQPAPAVVFEISSTDNWKKDVLLEQNVDRYARLGVHEYFAYDPLGYWKDTVKLRGWCYTNKQPTELSLLNGRLYSVELKCWLEPDGEYLRLYDNNYNQLLTEAEAERHQKETLQAELAALKQKLQANNINLGEL